MSRVFWVCLAELLLLATPTAQAQTPSTGVIVPLGQVSLDSPTGTPCEATWTAERLPLRSNAQVVPQAALQAVEDAYIDADNLSCFDALGHRELRPRRLLAREFREAAGRRDVLEAACALGSGDRARAISTIDRLLSRDLLFEGALTATTPELRALVGERRGLLGDPVELAIEGRPGPATIVVDGAVQCESLPCRVAVRTGDHVIAAYGLGISRHRVIHRVLEAGSLTLRLVDAPAARLRQQLANALVEERAHDTPELLALLARAFDARYVLTVSEHRDVIQTVLFDRQAARVLARSSSSAPRPADALIVEGCPAPLSENVELWVGISLAVVVVAAAVTAAVLIAAEGNRTTWEIRFE